MLNNFAAAARFAPRRNLTQGGVRVTKETKLGLVVGLSFIVLFAVLISDSGTQNREKLPATFNNQTAERAVPPPAHRPDANSRLHEGRMPEQALNPAREVRTAVPPARTPPEERPDYIADAAPRRTDGLPVIPGRPESMAAKPPQSNPPANGTVPSQPAALAAAQPNPAGTANGLLIPKPVAPDHSARTAPTELATGPQQPPFAAKTSISTPPSAPRIEKPIETLADRLNGIGKAAPTTGQLATGGKTATDPRTKTAGVDPGKPAGGEQLAAAESKAGANRTHAVRRGDTFSKLARQYYGTDSPSVINALHRANRGRVRNPHSLTVGQQLVIPVMATERVAAAPQTPEKSLPRQLAAKAPPTAEPLATAVVKPKTPVPHIPLPTDSGRDDRKRGKASPTSRDSARLVNGSESSRNGYTVRRGDTLSKIAERLLGDSSRADELYELNRKQLKGRNTLSAGTQLKLPGKSPATKAKPAGRKPTTRKA